MLIPKISLLISAVYHRDWLIDPSVLSHLHKTAGGGVWLTEHLRATSFNEGKPHRYEA
jgi:hypothetical protein